MHDLHSEPPGVDRSAGAKGSTAETGAGLGPGPKLKAGLTPGAGPEASDGQGLGELKPGLMGKTAKSYGRARAGIALGRICKQIQPAK